MNDYSSTQEGHGVAVAEHAPECRLAPKWAVVIGDQLFPMPRRKLIAKDILNQAGVEPNFVLVRDHNSPHDIVFEDEIEVDLAHGNVFQIVPRCDAPSQLRTQSDAPAKLAFVCDDVWEVTVQNRQTGHSLKRLFGLPDDAELLRDYESPTDLLIGDSETALFADGPVFTARRLTITVEVNNKPVSFTKKRVTGLEIKQTAIAQKVNIPPDGVLYRVKADGGLGASIGDADKVTLKQCDEFRCVTSDDNS